MIPFALQRLDHVVLRVRALDAMVAFYVSVLGCSVERRRDDLGLVHLRAGASLIDLIGVDGRLGRAGGAAPGAEGRNQDHLCLRIEPFDEAAIVRHLQGLGVAPRGPATINFGAEGDGPSLYFADPEGNLIELKGPPGPSTRPAG
jgi:catechol 2,3-dioxygenase-like lactoylglutathione lyase family enzyme